MKGTAMLSAATILVLFMALAFGLFAVVFFTIFLFFFIQGILINVRERFNA